MRWPAVIGIVLSVIFLWLALREADLGEVWAGIREANWPLLLVAIGLATLTFPIRTLRWRYLLRLEGQTIPFVPLWHATAIGFMAVNIFPVRTGELARAYAAQSITGVRFGTAIGSIAGERLIDALILFGFLMFGLAAGGFGSDMAIAGNPVNEKGSLIAAISAIALLLAFLVVNRPEPWIKALAAITDRILPASWASRVVEFARGVLGGLDALGSPKRLLGVGIWTLAVWLVGALSIHMAFLAFGIQTPFATSILLQSLLSFGVAIQLSPGFWGQWEGIAILTLTALYGIPREIAAAFALGFHFGGFWPITLLGLWSLSKTRLQLADLRASDGTADG